MAPPMGFLHFDGSGKDGEINYKFDSKAFDSEVHREYCLDTVLRDPETANDVNVYKDVIKRLVEDLTKLRRENSELKETVLAFSKRLPQVFQSLSSLSATIESEAHRFFARKAPKSEDETDYSTPSGEGSLTGEDYMESDLQDETSDEESRQAVVSIADDGTLHPVQNFVEIVSEEDNGAEDGSRANMANNALASNGNCNSNYKEGKDNDNKSSVTNAKTSLNNINVGTANGLKQKTSCANEKLIKFSSQNVDQIKSETKLNCHKEIKKSFESALKELQDEVDINIQMKESLEDPNKIQEEQKLKVASFARPTGMSVNVGKSSSDRRHGQQRIFSCDICGRTFSRSSNLLHHAMRHRNERPHQCKICDRAFVQKANLKVHLRSHTGERPYACDECGKTFAQKNNALRHLRAHARQRQRQEKKLECPMCGKSFGRGPSYETHMRRAHSSRESLKVVDCAADNHINKAHSNVGDMNICPAIVTINIPHHESPPQYIMQFSPVENVHTPVLSSVMTHPVLT